MKILVISQYYFPEPFRITDICEELVRKGNEVTVITGTPNYPMGNVYKGYENGKRADEIINGVTVHRCISAPRKTGALNRLINYFSFSAASSKYIKALTVDYDVVFVNQLSPVMMARAGIKYKKKHHKRLVLYCLDLWPESLCVGGIKKNSIVYKIFKVISKRIYTNADKILITSRMFEKYFTEIFSIEKSKIHYLPQYAEDIFLKNKEKSKTDEFNLLFAGNIGTAQSIDTIISAAELLKNENITFNIVGDGKELKRLKEMAKDNPKIIFHGRKPIEEMPKYYQAADAFLITLISDKIISMTLPGKVQSYMAAGKAIVGAANGETAIILNESQGGYCGEAENAKLLAENILRLINSDESEIIGRKNRDYYLKHFKKEKLISELLTHLE